MTAVLLSLLAGVLLINHHQATTRLSKAAILEILTLAAVQTTVSFRVWD
jgi:hypothetical protein